MASQPDEVASLALSTLAERSLASLLYLASHDFFPSIPDAAPFADSVPTAEKKRMRFMENVREFIKVQLRSGILAMIQDSPSEFLQLLENLRTSFDINGKFWYEVMIQFSKQHEAIALELQKARDLGQFNIMLKSQFCKSITQEALQSILRIYGRLSHKMAPLPAKLAAANEAVNALDITDVSATGQQDKVSPDNVTGKTTKDGLITMPAVAPKSTKALARLQAAQEKANDVSLRLDLLQHECNGVIKAVLQELAWKPPMSTLDQHLMTEIIREAASYATDVERDETSKFELQTGQSRADQLKFVCECVDNFIFEIKLPDEVPSVLVKMNQLNHIKTMLANFQDCDEVISAAEDVATAPAPDSWQSESLPVKNHDGSPKTGRNLQDTLKHMLDFPPDAEDDLSDGEEEQVEKPVTTPDKVDARSALPKYKHGRQSKLQLQYEFKTYIKVKDHQVLDTGSADTEGCFDAVGLSLANHEVLANHDWNLPSDAMISIQKFKMAFVRYLRAARDNNLLAESQEKLQAWLDLKKKFGPFSKPDIADLEHLGLILLTFQARFNVAFRLVLIDRTTGSPRELYLGHSRKAPIVFVSYVHGHYEGFGTIGRPGILKVDSESIQKLTVRTTARLFPEEYYIKQSGWDNDCMTDGEQAHISTSEDKDKEAAAAPEDDVAASSKTDVVDTASLEDDVATSSKTDVVNTAAPEDDTASENDAPSSKADIDTTTPEDDAEAPKDYDATSLTADIDATTSDDDVASSKAGIDATASDDDAASSKADIDATASDDDAASSKADIDATASDDDAASSKADIDATASKDNAAAPEDESAEEDEFVEASALKGWGAFVKAFVPKGRKGRKGKDDGSFELEFYQLRKLKYKDGKVKVVAERSCICM